MNEPSTLTTDDAVIDSRQLVKDFDGQRALDEVDLLIPRGTVVGIVGPSGCGKTTLVRTLTGAIRRTSGDVTVLGRDPDRFTSADTVRLGYMPQQPVLFPNLTLWGNLSFIASVYGMSVRGRRRRLRSLLELVDLTDARDKRLADCSGGMQRRLSLAATLVHAPELLFLDEPTAGIDPILRERFWQHFRGLRDEGRTIVVPTQYVGEAALCDLVAVMSEGRVLTVQQPGLLGRYAFGGDALSVAMERGWVSRDELTDLLSAPYVRDVARTAEGLVVVVDDASTQLEPVREWFARSSAEVVSVEAATPTMDELFVRIIERDRAAKGAVAA